VPVVMTIHPQEAGDIRTNVTYWNDSQTPVLNFGDSTLGIVRCNAQGTHSNTTTTSDSSISSVNDFYNGRTIVFVSGSLAGQAARITDYVGSTKVFTHTALANGATAANGDDFVVV
jgi:hypothetical protein